MNNKFDLSIIIVTMNRSSQLLEALESCICCVLPEKTEFVIINNGSSDNTDECVKNFTNEHKSLKINYRSLPENIGVGAGRTLGFDNAQGRYLYFLDDDAIISDDCRETFFRESVDRFERNSNIASITSRIYDEALGCDRDVDVSDTFIDGCPCIFKFLGGSHFLKKECFNSPLYLDIKYGSEEYAPSIIAQDKGYRHVYDDKIKIIHKPRINKWVDGTESKRFTLVQGIAGIYATKRILYPRIFAPVLVLGFRRRCDMYLKQYEGAISDALKESKRIMDNSSTGRIRIKTVIRLFRQFGMTTF